MQRYLHPGDYSIQIRSEIKALITEGSDMKLAVAETARVSYMKGKFNRRYDIANIFFLMTEYDDALTFAPAADENSTGDLIYFLPTGEPVENTQVYECIEQTVAGESPETAPTKWQVFNRRNPFVNLKLIDLIIYDLNAKYARRSMPQTVVDRYMDAKEWVDEVSAGDIDADLPQKSITDPGFSVDLRFNSHPCENQRY